MEILSFGIDRAPGGKKSPDYAVRFPINLQPPTSLAHDCERRATWRPQLFTIPWKSVQTAVETLFTTAWKYVFRGKVRHRLGSSGQSNAAKGGNLECKPNRPAVNA
jgi:hypothetical protein